MVYVYCGTGSEEMEFITVVDLLRRAGIVTVTVSVEESKAVKMAHGNVILADLGIEESSDDCDMMVLPGGMGGVEAFAGCPKLIEDMRVQYEAGRKVAAICAAPMLLAEWGFLEGKNATIYPGMEKHLIKGGAVAVDERVVTDGIVTTAKGPAVAAEFALELIRILKDEKISNKVKAGIVMA